MEVHDVADLRGQVVLPPPFYIRDILPKEGVMLLFGGPKIGKSYMSKQLAFSLATGQDFLGMETTQVRTAIVQFEISFLAYQWRLKQLLEHHYTVGNGWLYEASPGLVFLEDREPYEELVQALTPIQPRVIILDCLQSCFGGDENDSRDIGRFIGKVEELKRTFRASIILIHHSRKSPSTTSFAELARGQSRLTGWPDTLAYMHKQANVIKLQFMCRQATREVEEVNCRFVDGVFVRR